MKVQNLARP